MKRYLENARENLACMVHYVDICLYVARMYAVCDFFKSIIEKATDSWENHKRIVREFLIIRLNSYLNEKGNNNFFHFIVKSIYSIFDIAFDWRYFYVKNRKSLRELVALLNCGFLCIYGKFEINHVWTDNEIFTYYRKYNLKSENHRRILKDFLQNEICQIH